MREIIFPLKFEPQFKPQNFKRVNEIYIEETVLDLDR